MQALLLAAGMGKRLGKYTKDNTKCMLEIDGKTLIERTVEALLDAGINKLIIVEGYRGENLKNFLTQECPNPRLREMQFEFIENPIYDKTNNIYSLYLAKDVLTRGDTILLESDLIYDYDLIKRIVDAPEPNLVAVAKYEQWMDGTVLKTNRQGSIIEFIEKKDFDHAETAQYYKTVNIYKFSQAFSRQVFVPFLEAYIQAYGQNEYYELVLKIITHLSRSQLKAIDVSDLNWYEIDDIQDLDIAKCKFSSGLTQLQRVQERYGGYWRFEHLLDYCYLVNPYYPPQKMLDKIDYFSKQLITQYPSGQKVQCINASRLFGVDEDYLCVGNGAAELISALGQQLGGRMTLAKSAFNEYKRCFRDVDFDLYDLRDTDFAYRPDALVELVQHAGDIVCLVNPDNPTGAFIERDTMLQILDICRQSGQIVIFDESFIDFADPEQRYTLLDNAILEQYPNLIVIKSISKSYGVPGLRLGVLASSNLKIIQDIRTALPVWNINSYAEYWLQIATLFAGDYSAACDAIATERQRFAEQLARIKGIRVYPSAANFLLCQLTGIDSTELTQQLLARHIFIKDLKTKDAFAGQDFIRLAIRSREDNDYLIRALQSILEESK